jgi:hypothetical protein
LPTHDLFVHTPAFVNSQDVSTPVPHLILAIAVYPGRVQVEARLPPSGQLGIHQRRQRDMPHIAADTERYMVVAILWVQDALDDRVLVEVFLDQLSDVPLGPGSETGIFFRSKVDNEVAEEASAIEGFAEGRGDFPSIVSAVAGAERVDAMAILSFAVLANDVFGSAGADRRLHLRAIKIRLDLNYNIHTFRLRPGRGFSHLPVGSLYCSRRATKIVCLSQP